MLFRSGNVVLIELDCGNVTEVVTSFGKKGVPAETVAREAWQEARQYLTSEAPVGEHLADQLLLPLGISAHTGKGGGSYRTATLSRHTTTHIHILQKFLDVHIDADKIESDEAPDEAVFEIRVSSN